MKTKVFGIKEKDFYQFIKKINEFYSKQEVFATNPFIDKEGNYCAVIYFKSEAK